MSELLSKFKSRKFLAAVAGVVVGLCMVFGIEESEISNVAGAVVSVASLVAYIITEGKVDAAAVKLESTQEIVEELEVDDEEDGK
jgi:hypothetical protein